MKPFYCVLLVTLALLSACAGGETESETTKPASLPSDDDTDDDTSVDDDTTPTDDDDDDTLDDDDSADDDSADDDDDSADDDTVPTQCLIEGVYYDSGDTNPLNVCLVCDPEESTTNWTMNDGAACDDGVYCNGADVCLGGMCSVHNGTPCPDDHLFCTGIESCDEVNDECFPAYDPCPTDETCLEGTDTCEPTEGTCHGAAWVIHDVCEYQIPQYVGQAVYSTAALETGCNLIDSYYSKGQSPGYFFNCLEDCGREQACDPICMDACQDYPPTGPSGTGCDAVTYRMYTCTPFMGWWLLQPPNEMIWPLQDAVASCQNWDSQLYDWSCMASCMTEPTCNTFENCIAECLE